MTWVLLVWLGNAWVPLHEFPNKEACFKALGSENTMTAICEIKNEWELK